MKTTSSTQLQPLTPADLAHIRALAAAHSVGLERRCARYRRRANILRVSVALCLLILFAFGADTIYAQPPLYTENAIAGDISVLQACDTIYSIIDQI